MTERKKDSSGNPKDPKRQQAEGATEKAKGRVKESAAALKGALTRFPDGPFEWLMAGLG